MTIVLVLLGLLLLWILLKPYFINYDTVLLFTGGLGSGKSLISTEYVGILIRKNRRKVWWHNLLHPKDKWPRPLVYSSIPLRISRKEWSLRLTADHLLLQDKIVPRSVVYIDELDVFANQFDYKSTNIIGAFDEFMRLYRHYTKGGYIVCNTQASDNCVLQIRRRINTCYNLMYFKKYLGLFYKVKIRDISLSEELKTVEDENVEDGMRNKYGFLPVFLKRYDTYCYSERYRTVPYEDCETYGKLKTCRMLKNPDELKVPQTTSEDVTSAS